MIQSRAIAIVALIAALAAYAAPAVADGWRYRQWGGHHRPYAKRLYRGDGSIRYYNSRCTYGDCQCLRNIALATGSQVWWDRYQACTG